MKNHDFFSFFLLFSAWPFLPCRHYGNASLFWKSRNLLGTSWRLLSSPGTQHGMTYALGVCHIPWFQGMMNAILAFHASLAKWWKVTAVLGHLGDGSWYAFHTIERRRLPVGRLLRSSVTPIKDSLQSSVADSAGWPLQLTHSEPVQIPGPQTLVTSLVRQNGTDCRRNAEMTFSYQTVTLLMAKDGWCFSLLSLCISISGLCGILLIENCSNTPLLCTLNAFN